MKKPSLACSPVRCTKKAAGSWFTSLLTVSAFLSALIGVQAHAENSSSVLDSDNPVKQLTLQQLSEVQVTTASKAPEQIWKTPAAIYVITQEDIERAGVTSIPDALRLAPGSALSALKIPSYSTADARLGWWVLPSVELSVVGQNLLQPHHFEFASDPGPNVGIKRSVYGKITWQR